MKPFPRVSFDQTHLNWKYLRINKKIELRILNSGETGASGPTLRRYHRYFKLVRILSSIGVNENLTDLLPLKCYQSSHVRENHLEFMRVTLRIGCGKMYRDYRRVVCRIIMIWNDWLPISWLPWFSILIWNWFKKTFWDKNDLFRNDLMIDFMTVLSLDQTIQRLFRDYPEGIVHLRKLSNTQLLIKYFISQILHWPQDSKNIKIWPKNENFPKKVLMISNKKTIQFSINVFLLQFINSATFTNNKFLFELIRDGPYHMGGHIIWLKSFASSMILP